MPQLERIISRGFDRAVFDDGHVYVNCSQCEAMVINGTATHERGCPHATHECRGCNTQVPMRITYCLECQ